MKDNYRACKKELEKRRHEAKNEYYRKKLYEEDMTIKKRWDHLLSLIKRKKTMSDYCPIDSKILGNHYSTIAEKLATKFGFLYHWSYNKFYFDENYNRYLYQPFLRLANSISWLDWEFYDKYFINGFGKLTKLFSKTSGKFDYDGIDQGLVDGFGRVSAVSGNFLRNIQTGRLQNYLLFVVAGILVIIIAQAF